MLETFTYWGDAALLAEDDVLICEMVKSQLFKESLYCNWLFDGSSSDVEKAVV
jgi:hypothetical protein